MKLVKFAPIAVVLFSGMACAKLVGDLETAPIYNKLVPAGESIRVRYHLTRHASHKTLTCQSTNGAYTYAHWSYDMADFNEDLPVAITASSHGKGYIADSEGIMDIRNTGAKDAFVTCTYLD